MAEIVSLRSDYNRIVTPASTRLTQPKVLNYGAPLVQAPRFTISCLWVISSESIGGEEA